MKTISMVAQKVLAALTVWVALVCCVTDVQATAFTSTATGGNWSTPGTWTANSGFPGIGDTVSIVAGATVTVSDAESVKTVALVNATTSKLVINGTLTFAAAATTLISGSGIVDLSGGAGTLVLPGTSTIFATTVTLKPGTAGSTVIYNGSAGGNPIGVAYDNLMFGGGGSKTLTAAATVFGTLTVSNTTISASDSSHISSIGGFNQISGTLTGSGTLTVTGSGAGAWTRSGGAYTAGGTVEFTGAGGSAPNIAGSAATAFANLTIDAAASAATANANSFTVSGTLAVKGGFTVAAPVSSGTLGAGGVSVTSGGAFSVQPVASGGFLANATSLSDTSGTLQFNFVNGTPSTTVAPLQINAAASALTASSATLNIANAGGLALGTYPLISFTSGTPSTNGFTTQNLPANGSLQVSGSTIDLLVVGPTPVFSGLTASPSATYGATNVTLGGKLSAAGPIYPASGETITVTINGHAQTTTINDSTGDFSFIYNPSSPSTIPASGTPYSITYSYAGDSNLNATNDISTSLTVQPGALSITPPTIAPRPYDGTTTAGAVTVGTLSGFVGSETVTATATAAAYSGTNAGSYPGVAVTYTLHDGTGGGLAANYSLANGTATGQITPAPLTITSGITADSKVYDGTTNATISSNNVVFTGVIAQDAGDVDIETNGYTAYFASPGLGSSIPVTVTGLTTTGSAAGNYLVAPLNLSANITLLYSGYIITDSSNGVTMVGASDTLTITAVNSDATTNTGVSGPITLTFGGLANSPDGTAPTFNGSAGTATPTFSGGMATVTLVGYDATNSASLTVTDGSHSTGSPAGSPLILTVSRAPVSAYRIAANTTTPMAGNGDVLTLNIVDPYQNPGSFSGTKTITFGGLSAGPDGSLPTVTDNTSTAQPFGTGTVITFSGGAATATLVAHKVENGVTLTASSPGPTLTAAGTGGTAPTLSPVAGSAARLGISNEPSAAATAGSAFATQPVIAVLDQYGNPTTGSTASISVSSTLGTVFGTSPVNAIDSVATFAGLSLTNGGTNTLIFTSSGLISTNSTVITVDGGTFVSLGWMTQPGGAVYRTPFGAQPVLATVDQYGNATTAGLPASLPVTVTMTSGPGVLSGTTNYNLGSSGSNGVVSFTDLSINAVSNNFVLTASAALPAATTPPVTGMAVWLDASDTNSVIGTSPVTQWNDKSGNQYNFGVPAGSGTITYGTTNMNGLPVVSFSGGPALLTANNAYTFTGNSLTLFTVVRSSTYLAASMGPVDSAGAGGADGSSATWGMNAMYPPQANFTVQGTTVMGSGVPDGAAGPEIPFIWEGADNGPANQEWAGYFDGTTSNLVSNPTGAQSAFAITQLAVGSRLGGVNSLSTAWQGDVAEVLLYHSYLSLSQQAQTYSYLQSKWLGGGGGASISSATAPFTVSSAPITITGGITANSKAYDGTTNDTLTIGGVTFSGVFAPDNGNVNPNTSGAVGYFANAGPGNNIPVTVTGITLTGTAAGDYVVAPLVLSANINGVVAPYNAFVITNSGPGNLTAGVPSQLIVETVDNTGAVVTGINASIAVTFSGLSAGPDGALPTVTDNTGNPVAFGTQMSLNFISGVASVAGEAVFVAHKAETASPHITDGTATDATTGGSTISLTVVAGSPASLGISQQPSSTATAGTAFAQQPVIDVLDADGNVVASSSASINVSAAVGNVFGAFPTNAVNGVATFSGLSLTNLGANTLTFSSGGFSTNSTVITVSPATLTMTLASSENPSGYGDSVSFTGTVSPSVAGSLVFATNGVTFDTEALSGGSATSVTTTLLPRGTNPVTATYTGNPDYTGQTNLAQVVTNHPPVLNPANYSRIGGLELAIKFSDLLTNASDADNDTLTLGYVSSSTNGTSLFDDGTYLYYTNSSPPNVSDVFNYYVNDGFGGLTTNTVFLTVDNSQTGQPSLTNYVSGGQSKVDFTGMPNYIYYLQRTTNLTGAGAGWVYISTNTTSTNVVFNVIDTFPDIGFSPNPAFYRVLVP